MLDIPHGTTVPEMWPVFPNVNNQFNPFQPSVTFHMAVQTKWLVSIWNATLSWNGLTAGNNDSIPKYLPEKTELYWKTVIFTRLFNKSQKKKKYYAQQILKPLRRARTILWIYEVLMTFFDPEHFSHCCLSHHSQLSNKNTTFIH